NVPVEHGDGGEFLQIRKRLRAIVRAPTPFRIDTPQRDVGEDNYGRAFGKVLHVFLHPLKLFLAQVSQAAGLQVHDVDQPDEVHAFLIKAVPAASLSAFAETIAKFLAFVIDYVVFAGNVKDVFG